MIKHEETNKIKIAKEHFNKMIDILSLEDIETINQVLTEQEKKDELLGLYRENFNFLYNQIHMGMLLDYDKYMNNFEKIKSLEEELK